MSVRRPSKDGQPRFGTGIREFHEPGFDILLRSFCADSSSLQISAILVGHSTKEKDISSWCRDSTELGSNARRPGNPTWVVVVYNCIFSLLSTVSFLSFSYFGYHLLGGGA